MTKISTIGLDLAKNVFQVHGVDASGEVVLRRQLRRGAVEKFFAAAAALPGGHGSLRQRASLGAGDRRLWPRGAADAAGLCEALREAEQERWPGCGSDLRGGGPADDAVRAGEERGAAGGLAVHGTRALLVRQRTMAANALRAALSEIGIVAAQGSRDCAS